MKFSRGIFKSTATRPRSLRLDLRLKCYAEPLRRVQVVCARSVMHNHCDVSKDFAPEMRLEEGKKNLLQLDQQLQLLGQPSERM